MAFLDNDGDIILDVVLTDLGRERMARGDGSSTIVKWAAGDDEIDYGSYNRNHPSGSAFYDLEVMQTPILEAFTDNGASLMHRLVTYSSNRLLYGPVLKLNEVFGASTQRASAGVFYVAVDESTEQAISVVNGATVPGIILGETGQGGSYIRVDQGLDTPNRPPTISLPADLRETQYMIKVNNSYGRIVSRTSGRPARIVSVDDDNFAIYSVNLGTDPEFVSVNTVTAVSGQQTIAGPRGTIVEFSIMASDELNTSTTLFEQEGSTETVSAGSGTQDIYFIDSIIKVEGANTGFSVNVPVRFAKNQ